jgi:hypothetical protein
VSAATITVLCACGCGQPTPIANHTNKRTGAVAGEPLRYIHGHNGAHAARIGAAAKRNRHAPAEAAPGVMRCARCPYPLVPSTRRGPAPDGWRRHRARGLCHVCHADAEADGTLDAEPYMTLRRDTLLDEWEAMRLAGVGRREAAARLGMTTSAFNRRLRDAAAAGDPRAVMGGP